MYAPPDDPAFELVPEAFGHYADQFYRDMGSPPIFRENAWEVYTHLVARFEQMDTYADLLDEWEIHVNLLDGDDNALKPPSGLELCGGLDAVDKDGNYYMGGVNNGKGLGECAHQVSYTVELS